MHVWKAYSETFPMVYGNPYNSSRLRRNYVFEYSLYILPIAQANPASGQVSPGNGHDLIPFNIFFFFLTFLGMPGVIVVVASSA